MIDVPHLPDAALVAVLLVAAGTDLLRRRIPNALCLAVAALALLSRAATSAPQELWQPVAAGLVSLAMLLPLWARGLLGGGDLKLFVATALWVGLDGLLQLALAVALAGGLLALVALTMRRAAVVLALAVAPLSPSAAWLLTEFSESWSSLPYGVAIAAGAIWLRLYGSSL